jgi:hypothetical protein
MSESEKRGPGFTVSEEDEGLPRVDFPSFVLSLGTSALYHLGVVPDPETGQSATPNLPVARQTIDAIEMLKVKTRGNLDEEETKLLDGLLYELHMRFVEAQGGSSGGEGPAAGGEG